MKIDEESGVTAAEARIVFYGYDIKKGKYGPINSVNCYDYYYEQIMREKDYDWREKYFTN